MARVERPAGPLRARLLRARRAFGRTRPGRVVKRLLGREVRIPVAAEPDLSRLIVFPGEDELPAGLRDRTIFDAAMTQRRQALARKPSARRHDPLEWPETGPARQPIKNVVLVSHCNFTGNSAFHVHAIGSELHRRGLSPVIAVPDGPETVEDIGRPPFPVLTYDEARGGGLRFPDGRGPDLVHAFTPRELVRQLTIDLVRAHACPYVVHLEDNEETVLSAEHGGIDVEALKELPAPLIDKIVRPRQAHPLRAARFLEQAAGMTVLIERLLEFVPPGVPAAIVPAGFDEAVLSPGTPRDEVRSELGLSPSDVAIVYPGNIHLVNMEEMRTLWGAVAQLRSAGKPVVLVKSGWGSTQIVSFPALGEGLRDLGWVPRHRIPELLAAADVLVQPGGPGPFNDYRFPSKLPEFLASGRPVILPRTNLGLLLRDGEEALLLDRGDATEIAAAVSRLVESPALRDQLGNAGRDFALRELRWARSVDAVQRLYDHVARARRRVPPEWALDGADPPVKVVAIVPGLPSDVEAERARAHGIYGFCLGELAQDARPHDFRYCLGSSEHGQLPIPGPDPLYIRVDRLPLVGPAATMTPAELVSGDLAPRATALSAREPNYAATLRKLVLRRLLLAALAEPLVLVDASGVWRDQKSRAAWLTSTCASIQDGLRQYYVSRGVSLDSSDLGLLARTS